MHDESLQDLEKVSHKKIIQNFYELGSHHFLGVLIFAHSKDMQKIRKRDHTIWKTFLILLLYVRVSCICIYIGVDGEVGV